MQDKELAKSLFHLLVKVKKLAKAQLAMPSNSPLTETQFKTLVILRKSPKISLKELSNEIHVSSSSLSIMLNKLVEDDWVERHYQESDRRLTFFSLSSKGESYILKEVNAKIDELEDKITSLSRSDRDELVKSLNTINKIVEQIN